jgi:hypothetical protein
MSQPARTAPQPDDRLARFRAMMARLDVAGDPARAIDRDLYVSFPGGVGAKIAGRLELRPASTHLVVGGVGSGKTTELLQVRARLANRAEIKAIYIDVSLRHDIAKMVPGVVSVQAGVALAEFVVALKTSQGEASSAVDRAHAELRRLADGYWYHPDEYSDDDGTVFSRGILEGPDPISGTAGAVRTQLVPLMKSLRGVGVRCVMLLDGLDRLSDIEAFQQIVDEDVKALASMDLGVVLVGPLRSLYRGDHLVAEAFDYSYHQPWRDPHSDKRAEALLIEVVRRRLTADELSDQGLRLLVRSSGGVLRDLIAIAQLACEEAYISGTDVVGVPEVASAVDAFGRKHVLGLQTDEIEVLQRVRKGGSFVQTSDKDLALLMTRRVLEYATDSGPHYSVHPTIEPLLSQMADVPF